MNPFATHAVKEYLRLLAESLIDDLDEDELEDNHNARDGIWSRMSQAEQDAANELVLAVFTQWIV